MILKHESTLPKQTKDQINFYSTLRTDEDSVKSIINAHPKKFDNFPYKDRK